MDGWSPALFPANGPGPCHSFTFAVLLCRENVRMQQFVILGAGFDTRAYRFADIFHEHDVKVFSMRSFSYDNTYARQ